MKQLFQVFVLFVLLTSSCSDVPSLEELKNFRATENYPEDSYLASAENKRAIIIVAHDDDDCAMSGTIARLTTEGWQIKQLSLVTHLVPGETKNPAGLICLGNERILEDGYYRMGLDTMKAPYLPISREEISQQFLREKVAASLIEKVNAFRPSVLFTLDNIKGGYGHPEHIFISQLVLDLFEEGSLEAEKIYQSVYTDHMEQTIVDTWLKKKMENWGYPHASTIANELYGIDGMPEPDVSIRIQTVSDIKMKYLLTYPEGVRSNLRKFIPYYEEFDATTYFGIFDKEFFRVMEKD